VTDGPLLWFLNRGTGVVLLVLLTVVTVLGIAARRMRAGGRVPGFVVPALHRNLSVLALALLAVHGGSAVADEYVDIRWWQLVLPWRLSYEPWWLGLGTLACDLVLAVLVTSAVRTRLGHRGWRAVHWTAYGAWLAGTVHGLGIGTDTPSGLLRGLYVGCAAAVVLALCLRVVGPGRRAVGEPVPTRSVSP
jgi:methionine sulfoxide reductase heme-binding subunit